MDQPNIVVGTPSRVLSLLQAQVGVCTFSTIVTVLFPAAETVSQG